MTDVQLPIAGQLPSHPKAWRLVLTLGLAGILSGAVLAAAFQATKPAIDANKARALRAAVFEVVPGSTRMQRLVLRDGTLVPVGEDEARGEPSLYAAHDDDGAFLGYAIVAEGPGFQDTIRILYGYDPARRLVIGMYVLESRETPGLGDKIFKDEDFRANFTDLAVDPEIVLVKDGREAANEVDSITGATISSRAIVKILGAANARWLDALPAPGDEPPLAEPDAEPSPMDESGGAEADQGGDG